MNTSPQPIRLTSLLGILILVTAHSRSALSDEPVSDPTTKILHKLLMTETLDVRRRPSSDAPQVETVRPFTIRFLLKIEGDDEKLGGRRYVHTDSAEFLDVDGTLFAKVGKYEKRADGWIECGPKAQLLEPQGQLPDWKVRLWKTRSALVPFGDPNRPLKVFSDKSLQQDLAESSARWESGDGSDYLNLAMILEPPDEPASPTYNVTFCRLALGNPQEAEDNDRPNIETAKLEIVFVIDTTASMTDLVEGVKLIVQEIASSLGESAKERLRMGLVEYQDSTPGLTPARVSIPLTDVSSFVNSVRPLTVSSIPSEEWEEDVIAGILVAIDSGSLGGGGVGWSVNSSKHLIVMGDASAHLPKMIDEDGKSVPNPKSSTGLTLAQVITKAAPSQGASEAITTRYLHAVVAQHQDFDDPIVVEQFAKLAKNGVNDSNLQGGFYTVNPQDSVARAEVINGLVETIGLGAKGIANPDLLRKKVAANVELGPIEKAVWKLAPGIDPNRSVYTGWAPPFNSDDRQVAHEVLFITYDEFRRLKSGLVFLCDRLESLVDRPEERKDSERILQSLKTLEVDSNTGDSLTDEATLKDVISGLPLKSDALNITILDLTKWTDTEFSSWLAKIKAVRDQTIGLLENENGWYVLDPKDSSGKAIFLFVKDLP